jgi:polyphosphate kinase
MQLSPDGLSPASQLRLISERLRPLLERQMRCLLDEALPELEKHGVRILPYARLSAARRDELKTFFDERIFPVLTPLSVDPGHPFPYISNISLNLGTLVTPEPLRPEDEPRFARVKLPPNVPRLIPVNEGYSFILLEELMAAHIETLFPGMRVLECQPFRITRDADIEIEEDEAADLLRTIERQVRQRRFGFGVRLEVSAGMSPHMTGLLRKSLDLEEQDVYPIDGPLNIPDLMALCKLDLPELKDKPFTPATPPALVAHKGETIFDAIRRQDILLHHPYESFTPVVEFISAAARDPQVLAIKQTLYRVGQDSPIVNALIEAAERGKQVAVLVELKARFDEENNIQWARRLEKAGAHVIYGVLGLKTHAKLALVVRQEENHLQRYVHLGTGNYNTATARVYTDLGLLTCDADFGADVSELFNYLTGYSRQARYRCLLVAPVNLRQFLERLIRRETRHAQAGRPAGIEARFNSLTDGGIIEELYAASRAGVPIDLVVRGICCLRPQAPGLSETIRVGSLVGRFLEHERVYRFINGGRDEIYLGSADLMTRNLDRRVEVLFPIRDERLKERVRRESLEAAISDNVKLRWLNADGACRRAALPGQPFDCQKSLLEVGQMSLMKN